LQSNVAKIFFDAAENKKNMRFELQSTNKFLRTEKISEKN